MGHNITALIVKGDIKAGAIKEWDLIIQELPFDLKLCYVDHYYTACWQKLKKLESHLPNSIKLPSTFPTEIVLLEIARDLKSDQTPMFAVIFTDYFGGIGEQFAQMFQGAEILDPNIISINQALKKFGVQASRNTDEFDTIGLGKYRHNPDYLEKYWDMADELGV